jgi:alpha-L-rhamnosidase
MPSRIAKKVLCQRSLSCFRWRAYVLSWLLALILVRGLVLGSPAGAAAASAPLAPTGLLVELHPHPLAVEDLAAPRLSWIVQDPRRGARQSAYQILIATQTGFLKPGEADVWDSGMVKSAAAASVPYAGPALQPATRYYWTVRTWDDDGKTGPFSEAAFFGTALKDQWGASPIWAGRNVTATPTQLVKKWQDYRVSVDMTIHQGAASLLLRAHDHTNNYLWQFRTGQNELARHIVVDGRLTVDAVRLPLELKTGIPYRITIEAIGDTIRTSINERLVDEFQSDRFRNGVVGIRHGEREQATYANLQVQTPDGSILFESDLRTENPFPCGRLTPAGVRIGRSERFLIGRDDDIPDDFPQSRDHWALLRTDFTLRDVPISYATLYATGISPERAAQHVYRATLNGQFIGVGPTRGYNGMTFYNAFDVTQHLQAGSNTLAFVAYATHGKAVQAQLDIVYSDGERQRIGTNATDWQARSGADLFLHAGYAATDFYWTPREYLRADRWPDGFDRPDFDAVDWGMPVQRRALSGLTGLGTRNLKEEIRKPISVASIGRGAYQLDFGRNVVGGLRLNITGKKRQHIDIRLGEERNANGSVRYRMRTGNHYRDRWTIAVGAQTLQHFGYRVFRYAEVHGLPDDFDIANLVGVGLVYPFDENAASFSSSNPHLDEVWQFCRDSIRLLNMELYMDTPSRERRAYEGDAYLQQLAHYALDRDYTLARHSIEYLYFNYTWPTEWKLTSPSNAWRDYLQTGDARSAETYFEVLRDTKTLRSFMDARNLVLKAPGERHQRDSWTDLVDWPVILRDGYIFSDVNTLINAYNYRALRDFGSLAKVLGHDHEAHVFSTLAGNAANAINQHLFDPQVNRYRDGYGIKNHALHASIFPLAFGIATEREAAAAQYLIDRRIVGNFFSASYQIEALFALGHAEAAIDLLSSDDVKSWRNMIRLGAGTTMETWDPRFKPNTTYSHPAAASPVYLLPMGLFGIDALEPAHRRFSVEPQPGGLVHASIQVPTLSGTIKAAFQQKEEILSFQLTVPANTTAELRLPSSAENKLQESGKALQEVADIRILDISKGQILLEVQGGSYHFSVMK